MDETLRNSTTEFLPKNCSCFPACFGSSNKKLSKDMKAAPSSSKNNKTTSLTFLSRFCANKSTVETVQIKAAVPEKPYRSTKEFTDQSPKLHTMISPQKNNKQAAAINTIYSHKKDDSEIDKLGIVEKNSKFHRSILLVKDPNRQNPKKEKKRSRSSSFVPLQVENDAVLSTKTTRVLPHSISLPPPNRPKETPVRGENEIKSGGENEGKLDPIIGMTIMMGTLVIMLIWGKVCAILCTCAWLYMVPRLRTVVDSRERKSGGLDFESVEYKKKVVLEGLLKRDRRRVAGNL
ncbi:hypothetical protein ACET3Z_002320 [Daucus carota]